MGRYAESDLIFVQLTRDSSRRFRPHREAAGGIPGKVIVWPNVFFRGACPDLNYVTSNGTRLLGPLGHYHNRFV
jgi:hypothetical protein